MSDVDSIISDQRAYAGSAVEGATNAMASAVNAIEDIPTFHATHYNYSYQPIAVDDVGELNEFNAIYVNQIALPETPEHKDFELENLKFPEKPELNYDVELPESPSFNVSSFNGVAPVIPDFDLPPSPEVVLKAAPLFERIDLGELDNVDVPAFNAEFNEVAPEYSSDLKAEYQSAFDGAAPALQNFVTGQMDDWVAKNAPDYNANRDRLELALAEGIETGKALSDSFETALYNRAKSRVERERERVESDLETSHSKRGFSLPQGALMAGRNKLHQAAADSIAKQSTEIAIERAKMEVQHKQFVMGMSQDLHKHVQGMAIQYAGVLLDINRQSLEAARDVAGVVAKNYELVLNRYKEVAQVYAIQASTYEVKLDAAMANVKVFKERAEAAKISASVDALTLEAYSKELEFELTKVEVYKAELDGIGAIVAINKQRMDAYGVEAQVYATKVNGEEAKFNAYSAAINGEESKVQLELARLSGYESELKAIQIKVDVEKVRAGMVTEFNRTEASVHAAGVDAYKASAGAESSRLTSESTVFRAKADGFRSSADVKMARIGADIKNAELALKAVSLDWQVSSSENVAAGKLATERAKSIASVSVSAASTYAALAGSALSSQNTMVSLAEKASV